ncbi:YnbE family lipoprotein [Microbulbifer taiwanensis]|uniref:YnbE family lipoprotein n=1 Tax=Microbulbifer taiwanensis TaxID=986746 RepID=A0ABW1YQT2_9GAMM|nr:YnbE family lipoprotein [Microbulbifer taiwanensis]
MSTTRLRPLLLAAALVAAGCTPTVAVQAPSEPITVNLNVKIEHEIRVRVDRELDDLFEDKEGIF